MDMMEFLRGFGRDPNAISTQELLPFLQGQGPNNRYLQLGQYNTYLRRANRYLPQGDYTRTRDRAMTKTLDLANITRPEVGMDTLPPDQRPPRGQFKELLALLEQHAAAHGYDAVYAENILNAFLPDVLRRYGYVPDLNANSAMPDIPSMYKRIRPENPANFGGGML